jgi:hypothetical protein
MAPLPSSFDPSSPLSITVSITGPNDPSPGITVLWGDGTEQFLNGTSGTNVLTHQYRVFNTTYELQIVAANTFGETSTPVETVVAALPTVQQGTVAALYLNLLERNVDPDGLNHWTTVLASGAPLSQVVSGITASTEYQDRVINNLYQQYLGRTADPAGLGAFVPLLRSSGPQAVAAALAGSQEFFAASGGSNTGFLQALYLDALQRAINPAELTAGLNALSQGVLRQQFAAGVLGSAEAAQDTVARAYQTDLGRAGDPTGVQFWEQVYLNDPKFLAQFLSAAAPELTQQAAVDASVVPTIPGGHFPPFFVPLVSPGGSTSPGEPNPPGMQPLTSAA